jgi:arylsulfatase
MDNGRLRFAYNYGGRDLFELETKDAIAAGRHALRFEFEPTGPPDIAVGKGTPGRAQLYVDGVLVAVTEFPHTTPLIFELEGLSCGYDFGSPATDSYEPPFPFTGTIHSVTYDLSGDLTPDDDAALARLMAQQ